MLVLALDLTGVFAFAMHGGTRAVQARMNSFGVFVCAGAVALGGGVVRELLLNGTPVFLSNYWYVLVVALAAILSWVFVPLSVSWQRCLILLDGIGLGAFAVSGAIRAAEHGLGLGGMLLCGALTAVGGGVICDLLVGRRPELFYGDKSAVAVLSIVVLTWFMQDFLDRAWVVVALVTLAVMIHLMVLRPPWLHSRRGVVEQALGRNPSTARGRGLGPADAADLPWR